MTIDEIRRLSDLIAAITGAGPAYLYTTAPTPATERVVLSDGVRYTRAEAVARLSVMLEDARAGRGWFYCRVCKDAVQLTRKDRDAHEWASHSADGPSAAWPCESQR